MRRKKRYRKVLAVRSRTGELGEPIDLEKFFEGKAAPAYEQVARYVVYTATGASVAEVPHEPKADWFHRRSGRLSHSSSLQTRSRLHARQRGCADARAGANGIQGGTPQINRKPCCFFAAQKYLSQAVLFRGSVSPSASCRIRSIAFWAERRMRLKKYQTRALETLSSYLTALSEAGANIGKFDEALAALPEHLRGSIPKPETPISPGLECGEESGSRGVARSVARAER